MYTSGIIRKNLQKLLFFLLEGHYVNIKKKPKSILLRTMEGHQKIRYLLDIANKPKIEEEENFFKLMESCLYNKNFMKTCVFEAKERTANFVDDIDVKLN